MMIAFAMHKVTFALFTHQENGGRYFVGTITNAHILYTIVW